MSDYVCIITQNLKETKMVVFGQRNKPIIIDSLYTPIVEDHIWVLDLEINDFTLTPLAMLQEIVCSSISLQVNGVDMILPANWFMLVYDEETTMLDVVQISELSGRPFRAFTYGFKDIMATSSHVRTIDYHPQFINVVPSLNKKQMLCHPINNMQWICIGSTDAFSKNLKDMTVGDIT